MKAKQAINPKRLVALYSRINGMVKGYPVVRVKRS